MIFHDLKAIFMHVERTGGVSIRKHLLHYETNFERIGSTKHYTVEETKEKVGDLWNKYFTFGFVRNPYERLVSWYFACKKNAKTWNSPLARHVVKCKTFSDLIYNPHEKIIIPQYKKVEGIDFIGRFENFEVDMRKVCDKLGIPSIREKANTSEHEHYYAYYTPETKKIVTEWFKEDLERFNYAF